MNILILSNATATALIAKQTGQHRLGPVALTDGRFFLSADVLLQPELFGDRMIGVEYEEATLMDVHHLLPVEDFTTSN
jgi:hypothetical protein